MNMINQENDTMEHYAIVWKPTESITPQLVSCNNKIAVVCTDSDEAMSIFDKELQSTSMSKSSDLDFEPSDKECRQHLTYLMIISIIDGEPEIVQESEGYWADF